MKINGLLLCLLFLCHTSWAQCGLVLETTAASLTATVDITNAGDERLFVAQKTGRIRIITEEDGLLPSDFLNITSKIDQSTIWNNERGLLGLAFHPNYAENGFFYVFYTNKTSGMVHISRFSVTNFDRNKGDVNSETVLLTIEHSANNHLAGDLAFGPDGYLYIAVGDALSANNISQDKHSYLGKILRIDVDNGEPYAIPDDNPYVNGDGKAEIWASGLRNPWRISFDRLTGDFWVSDVGGDLKDEINFQAADSAGGANYGWKCFEGSDVVDESCADSTFTLPVHEYSPVASYPCKSSVTGGFVYRGSAIPSLYGKYVYGDFCSGDIWALSQTAAGWTNESVYKFLPGQISTFGQDSAGELYLGTYQAGVVMRIQSVVANPGQLHFSENNFCAGDSVSIQVTTENEGNYSYRWLDAEGNIVQESTENADVLNLGSPQAGTLSYTAEVSDTETGCSSTKEVTVTIANPNSIALEESYTGTAGASLDIIVELENTSTYSYEWTLPNGTVQMATTNADSISLQIDALSAAAHEGSHLLTVIDEQTGCITAAAFTITVTEEEEEEEEDCELTDANISGNLEVCEGERTVLTASGGISYAWNNFARSNKVGVLAGTYTVTITDTNDCVVVLTATVTEVDCSQPCPPKVPPQSNGDVTACFNEPIPALSVSTAGVNLSSEIRWYEAAMGGEALAVGFEFTPPAAGTYYAEIFDTANNCPSPRRAITLTLIECGVHAPTTQSLSANHLKVQVQPNPFRNSTRLLFEQTETNWVTLSIYDLAGKQLHQQRALYSTGSQQITIQDKDLGENGIYIYRLQSAEHTVMGKLILQR